VSLPWEKGIKTPLPQIMKRIISFLGYLFTLGVDKNSLAEKLYI